MREFVGKNYRVLFAYFRIVSGARADGSLEGCSIHLDQAEAWPEAFVPLEVVEERPVEIALDVGAIFYCAVDGGKGARQEFLSERVAPIGEAVFGDVDGFSIRLQFYECLINRFRIEFPTKVRALFIRIFVKTIIDDISSVMIETDEILFVLNCVKKPRVSSKTSYLLERFIDECLISEFKGNIVFRYPNV